MTGEQVRWIYAQYIREASIDRLAEAVGFTHAAVRRQLRKRKLPTRGELVENGAKTAARVEQQMITALLMARVDELRKARGLTVERLAQESDLSMFTIKGVREELRDPKLTTVLRICRGLDVTVQELLSDLPFPVQPRPRIPRTRRTPR
jgi:DNA-binding XRE family transcriptional regulator